MVVEVFGQSMSWKWKVIRNSRVAYGISWVGGCIIILAGLILPSAFRYAEIYGHMIFIAWLMLLASVAWFDTRLLYGKMIWWFVSNILVYIAIYYACHVLSPPRFMSSHIVAGVIVGFLPSCLLYVGTRWIITRFCNMTREYLKTSECQRCGYLLSGLNENRCPECGTEFDPKLLEQSSQPAGDSK